MRQNSFNIRDKNPSILMVWLFCFMFQEMWFIMVSQYLFSWGTPLVSLDEIKEYQMLWILDGREE